MTDSTPGGSKRRSGWRPTAALGFRFAPYVIGFAVGAVVSLALGAQRLAVAFGFICGGLAQLSAQWWWRRAGRHRDQVP